MKAVLWWCGIVIGIVLCSVNQAGAVLVSVNGVEENFEEVLYLRVEPDAVRKPSGRTLVSGLSYWLSMHKFGSAGLEPDPIATSLASDADFAADYSRVIVEQGFDTGQTKVDSKTYASTGIRDVIVRVRDEQNQDLLVFSSSPANNLYINGNKGGLFQYNLGTQGASVESLFTLSGGSLFDTIGAVSLFGIIESGAIYGRTGNDLYFAGLELRFFAPQTPPVTEVPEPMGVSLLLSGLLAGLYQRKRAK